MRDIGRRPPVDRSYGAPGFLYKPPPPANPYFVRRFCYDHRFRGGGGGRSTDRTQEAAVVTGAGCGGDEEGKETRSAKVRTAQVVPAVDAAEADVVVPYVMAVDDSNVDRAVVTALLRRSKYRVTAVDSGKRALEILDSRPNVIMIITDYWMPEMTGYDLLKKVKESSELKQIPVVIMSSENVPTRITRCLEEGAEEFLLKPVRPSDISRICTRILK